MPGDAPVTALTAVVVAATVVVFALVSGRMSDWPLTMPMVFVGFGAATAGLGWVQVPLEAAGLSLLGEVALAVILFADAVRIDIGALRRELGIPVRLLAVALPLTIALGALIGWGVLPGVGLWEAALLAAVLAPTDAALGQAVVENESVPQQVRQGLNVESGLNDGLALPAVLLFLALISGGDTAAGFWVVFVLQQVGLALVMGLMIGGVGGRLLSRARTTGWAGGIPAQIAVLALALLALAGAEVAGANGFIAAFVAGLTFGVAGRDGAGHLDEYTEDTGRLLAMATFFVFGNVFVPQALPALSWPILLCAALVLTLGRVLPVAVALRGSRAAPPTVLFIGWFGPRGIASILFGLLVLERGIPAAEEFFAVITVTVTASVVLHGATAAWGARRYASWFARRSDRHARMPEADRITEHRVRWTRSRGAES